MIEQMKKLFSIFFAALLAVACVEPLQPCLGPVDDHGISLSNGPKMTMEFSIPFSSPATKGEMTDQPNITAASKVHVFVYNATSGALLQVSKATLKGTVTSNTPWGTAESAITNHADFVVEVDMGSAHRYLQVVVDAPTYSLPEDSTNDNETGIGYADNPIYLGDSETDVASKLYTRGGATAYWQRIDLPNGLQAYTYPGGTPTKGDDWTYTGPHTPDDYYVDGKGQTVYVGDFVNASGYKITDGTGYVMSTDVANRVKYIPLVRNFVKIRVSKADDGTFTPQKAVLINVPASGYIAPYSSASGFVSFYQKDLDLKRLQKPENPIQNIKYGTQGIDSTGYTAPVPNDEYDTDCPAESKCVSADNNGVIPLYMYERGVATSNPTQLLVYGRFDDSSSDCWLKIDITDTDGHYIAFYRDLTYEMEIGAITGTPGYRTMQEAYNMPSVGNPSSSPETQTLTQVSDGKGTMIWVDFIDYASFDKNANSVRLRYKFVSFDDSKTSADAELSVTHKTATGAVTRTDLTGYPYSGTDTQDEQDGWYYVNVPLAAQGSTIMRSVVRVSGTATNSVGKTVTLYRDVTFSVMPTQNMTVSISPLSSDTENQNTTATITLPDGLGYSLFPLVIRIEPYNGSLSPTDSDLPVGHGTSTFSTLNSSDTYYRTDNYYWYEKTISYDDYEGGTRVYTAHFKTIYTSGNETMVAFSDPYGHFNTSLDYLSAGPVFKLSTETTSVAANETSAKFNLFSTGENPEWTMSATSSDGSTVQLSEESGSGSKAITVRFTANEGSERTFTVTVRREGYTTPLTFTVTQRASEFEIANISATSIGPDATSVTFDITSTSNAEWTVSTENEGVTFVKTTRAGDPTTISGTRNATITVNIPDNYTGTEDKEYVFTVSCPSMNKSESFTIMQAPLSLTLTSDDVFPKKASETTASIKVGTNSTAATWTAKMDGETITSGQGNATIEVTFTKNEDYDNTVTHIVTVTIGGISRDFTITQAKKVRPYYSINLDAGGNNGTYGYNWEDRTNNTGNADSNTYYFYRSNSTRQGNSIATMSITVVGYTEFTVYIRSFAESDYDYVVVRKLDGTILTSWNASSAYNDSGTKANTKGNQQSGTTISSYTTVTFNSSDDGLTDDETPHTFYIQYGKDSRTNSNDDRGYILIPKTYNKQ